MEEFDSRKEVIQTVRSYSNQTASTLSYNWVQKHVPILAGDELIIYYFTNLSDPFLRWLDSFDCHKVFFATFSILLVYLPSHNNTIYILKSLKSLLWKILGGDPIFFLHILLHILISNYYEKFYRYLMTFSISNLS